MQESNIGEQLDSESHLFVGHFKDVPGIVETQDGDINLKIRGEFLLGGEIREGVFELGEWQRIFIVGVRLESIQNDSIGVLSLGGPLPDADLKSDNDLQMMLHYRLLSQEDPFNPRVEPIGGNIQWENMKFVNEDPILPDSLKLEGVMFSTVHLAEGYVKAVRFKNNTEDPITIKLERIKEIEEQTDSLNEGDPLHVGDSQHVRVRSLSAQNNECKGDLKTGELRCIPIKFINLTDNDILQGCKEQIKNVKKIWRDQAAVDLYFYPQVKYSPDSFANFEKDNIVDVPDGTDSEGKRFRRGFEKFTDDDDGSLAKIPGRSPDYIDVVVVQELEVTRDGHKGGVTYAGGTSAAVCILAHNHLIHNTHLLAHELSHVIGLEHPEDNNAQTKKMLQGSKDSVADADPSFWHINTEHNRKVLGDMRWPSSPYETIGKKVFYCPDKEDID